jgi:hypothetical protein
MIIHTGSNDGPFKIFVGEKDGQTGQWAQLSEIEATDSSGTGVGPWEIDTTVESTIEMRESFSVIYYNMDVACSFFTLVVTLAEQS